MTSNTFISRRPRVAIFADIIKIVTMFIKTVLKDSKQVKRIRNYVPNWNLYLFFLKKQNLLISDEKMLMLAELREFFYVIHILFESSLGK